MQSIKAMAFTVQRIVYIFTKNERVLFFILHRDLMDELVVYIREAVDRKQENMRRRRRRDALRLQLVKVLQNIAENGTFGVRYGR